MNKCSGGRDRYHVGSTEDQLWLYMCLFSTGEYCLPFEIAIELLVESPGLYMNIFVDMNFQCEVVVHGWHYYQKSLGSFFAAIWRPVNGTHVKLVGKNIVRTHTLGRGVIFGNLIYSASTEIPCSIEITLSIWCLLLYIWVVLWCLSLSFTLHTAMVSGVAYAVLWIAIP